MCSRLFFHVNSCIFICTCILKYNVIIGNTPIYKISILGKDYPSYSELVSYPFDFNLINKICSIHIL